MSEIVHYEKLEDILNNTTWKGVEFDFFDEFDQPIDLSDSKARCQFRRNGKNGVIVLDVELGSGMTLKGVDNNTIAIDKVKIDWGVNTYYFDIHFTNIPTSDENVYIEGIKKVLESTTKIV